MGARRREAVYSTFSTDLFRTCRPNRRRGMVAVSMRSRRGERCDHGVTFDARPVMAESRRFEAHQSALASRRICAEPRPNRPATHAFAPILSANTSRWAHPAARSGGPRQCPGWIGVAGFKCPLFSLSRLARRIAPSMNNGFWSTLEAQRP